MVIPLNVKRRYVEISEYLEDMLREDRLRNVENISTTKEGFILRICEHMSFWYIQNYQRGPYDSHQTYHRTLGEHTLIFRYMFRTRLREHYERRNHTNNHI